MLPLNDLLITFDYISPELLIVELHVYSLSLSFFKLVNDYLLSREMRTKLGSSHSAWKNVPLGVPQCSVLGPLLFNIFPCDLCDILENNDFTIYADETSPYVVNKNTEVLV